MFIQQPAQDPLETRPRRDREQVVAVADSVPATRVLVVKLPFGIATPWAYRQWKESREVPGLPYPPQPTELGLLTNDLERPVFEKYQVLGHLKAALIAMPGVYAALMSGSGSTIFALLEESADLALLTARIVEEAGREVQIIATRLATGLHAVSSPAGTSPLSATDVAL